MVKSMLDNNEGLIGASGHYFEANCVIIFLWLSGNILWKNTETKETVSSMAMVEN